MCAILAPAGHGPPQIASRRPGSACAQVLHAQNLRERCLQSKDLACLFPWAAGVDACAQHALPRPSRVGQPLPPCLTALLLAATSAAHPASRKEGHVLGWGGL
eukprot:9385741-Pyramimonas_sp.AAC.1